MLSSGVTKRSRHYSIEWFKMHDLIEQKELHVSWVPTGENLADFFTKKLPRERFCLLRDKLMGTQADQNWFIPIAARCVYVDNCDCHLSLPNSPSDYDDDMFLKYIHVDDYLRDNTWDVLEDVLSPNSQMDEEDLCPFPPIDILIPIQHPPPTFGMDTEVDFLRASPPPDGIITLEGWSPQTSTPVSKSPSSHPPSILDEPPHLWTSLTSTNSIVPPEGQLIVPFPPMSDEIELKVPEATRPYPNDTRCSPMDSSIDRNDYLDSDLKILQEIGIKNSTSGYASHLGYLRGGYNGMAQF
jgi:hypothetical protein